MYTADHHLTTHHNIGFVVCALAPGGTSKAQTHHKPSASLWGKQNTSYLVRKCIHILLPSHEACYLWSFSPVSFNGFIPAYLKMFLFAIYTLTEFSLLVLNKLNHWNRKRFKDKNAQSQYEKKKSVKLIIEGAF